MLDQDEFEIPGDEGFGPGTDFVVSIVSILMVMLTLLRLTSFSVSSNVDVDHLLEGKRSFWMSIVDTCTKDISKIEREHGTNRRVVTCRGIRFHAEDRLTFEIFSFGSNVLFSSNEDNITERGAKFLKLFGGILASQHLNILELQIIGHTDWLGSSGNNFDLGWQRAKAVYDFLIEQGLIDPKKVLASIASYGEHNPYDRDQTNKSFSSGLHLSSREENKRMIDRRIEIKIYYRTER